MMFTVTLGREAVVQALVQMTPQEMAELMRDYALAKGGTYAHLQVQNVPGGDEYQLVRSVDGQHYWTELRAQSAEFGGDFYMMTDHVAVNTDPEVAS